MERTPGVHGFAVLPKCWIVERTFGWLSRNRHLSKDYEGKFQTSETLIEVAMIRLLIARQGRLIPNNMPDTLLARNRAGDGQTGPARKR